MSVIDSRGRVFGRFNLVDTLVVSFVLLLIPLGYATSLLFRPAAPRIDSVTPAEISRQERRLSLGGVIAGKFKVTGTGLNPMLRAFVGDTQALAFVFENPNSADVLVGPVPPGAHDLVLFDGVQEVARARGAISVKPGEATFIRASGFLINLDSALIEALPVGAAFPAGEPMFEVLALGPLQPAMNRVHLAGSQVDQAIEGQQERAALLTLRCDPAREDNPCTLGDRPEGARTPTVLSLPGPVRFFAFAVYELLPMSEPSRARVQVRLIPEAPVSAVQVGDRDAFLDARAAVVTSAGPTITLDMGVDESREGWRYRSQRLRVGAPFVLATDRYDAAGYVQAITIIDRPAPVTP